MNSDQRRCHEIAHEGYGILYVHLVILGHFVPAIAEALIEQTQLLVDWQMHIPRLYDILHGNFGVALCHVLRGRGALREQIKAHLNLGSAYGSFTV